MATQHRDLGGEEWSFSPGITNSSFNPAPVSPYGGGRLCQVLGAPGGAPRLLSMY